MMAANYDGIGSVPFTVVMIDPLSCGLMEHSNGFNVARDIVIMTSPQLYGLSRSLKEGIPAPVHRSGINMVNYTETMTFLL
jgi:hypothetical protein